MPIIILLFFSITAFADIARLYPDIPVINANDLFKTRKNVLIIDTSTTIDLYDRLHIKTAKYLNPKDYNIVESLKKIVNNHKDAIVFYCQGYHCPTAFPTARKAKNYARLKNQVYVYQGGLLEWIEEYPEYTAPEENIQQVLELVAVANKHFLAPEIFVNYANVNKNSIILINTAGYATQSDFSPFFMPKMRIRWDEVEKLKSVIVQAKEENKTLMFFDKTGFSFLKIVPILQENNIENYFFMQDGLEGYNNYLLNE